MWTTDLQVEKVVHCAGCRASGRADPYVVPGDTAFRSGGGLGFPNKVISSAMEVGRRKGLRDHGPSAQRQPLPPERHRCSQNRQGCLGCSLLPHAAPETAPGCGIGPAPARPGENPQSWLIERRRVRGARVGFASFVPLQSGQGNRAWASPGRSLRPMRARADQCQRDVCGMDTRPSLCAAAVQSCFRVARVPGAARKRCLAQHPACYLAAARKLGVGRAPISACLDGPAAVPGDPATAP